MTWQLVKNFLRDNHSQFLKFVVKISNVFFFFFSKGTTNVFVDQVKKIIWAEKKNYCKAQDKKKKKTKLFHSVSNMKKHFFFCWKCIFTWFHTWKKIYQINKELWRQTLSQILFVTRPQVINTRENNFVTCPSGLPYPCEHYKLCCKKLNLD